MQHDVDLSAATLSVTLPLGDIFRLPITIKEGGVAVDVSAREYSAALLDDNGDEAVPIDVVMVDAATGVIVPTLATAGLTVFHWTWRLRDLTNGRTLVLAEFDLSTP